MGFWRWHLQVVLAFAVGAALLGHMMLCGFVVRGVIPAVDPLIPEAAGGIGALLGLALAKLLQR
jgi:hypothetical protein